MRHSLKKMAMEPSALHTTCLFTNGNWWWCHGAEVHRW